MVRDATFEIGVGLVHLFGIAGFPGTEFSAVTAGTAMQRLRVLRRDVGLDAFRAQGEIPRIPDNIKKKPEVGADHQN